jgi:hypothetical protein
MLAREAGWDGNPVVENECDNAGDCVDLECNSKECVDSKCVYSNLIDGTDCSNEFFCDGVETCQSGVCVSSGNPCEEDGYSCTTNSCNEISNQCDLSMDDNLCLVGFNQCSSAVCDPSLYPLTGCGNYNPFGCEEYSTQINYDDENLVSIYLFDNVNDLGADYNGVNSMSTSYTGSPAGNDPEQSTDVPSGFSGYSIDLDGDDSVCISSGATFNPSQSHTLCWWTKPNSLDTRDQFAQYGNYDSWVQSGGNYRWSTKNLDSSWNYLDISSVYSIGQWTHICNNYNSSTLTKTVYVDGVERGSQVVNGIVFSNNRWCIGSYGTGSFLNGKIFQPVWFDKSLTSEEINQVYSDF